MKILVKAAWVAFTLSMLVRPLPAVGQATVSWGVARALGGATPTHFLSAATTNSTNVKTTGGNLFALSVVNTNAATAFLKFYDKATAPVCNTDTVFFTIALVQNIPVNLPLGPGANFNAGIGFCITGAAADSDNTNATTGITLSLVYQ